jgi:hypothetical protein
MNWNYLINGFQFKHNPVIDKKINAKPTFQFQRFVDYRNGSLSFKSQTMCAQFIRETLFISRLKQPRTQLTMDFDCGTYDRLGNPVLMHISLRLSAALRPLRLYRA